jgi:jumonji domain-containing protein 2
VEQKPLSIKKDFKPKAMMKENMPSEAAMQDTSVRDRK